MLDTDDWVIENAPKSILQKLADLNIPYESITAITTPVIQRLKVLGLADIRLNYSGVITSISVFEPSLHIHLPDVGVVDRVSKDAFNSMYINQARISQDVLLLLLKGDYNAIAKTEPLLYKNADSIIRFCNLLVSSDYLSDELNARLRVTFSRIRSAVNRTRI